MSQLVTDASAVMGWLFDDEESAEADTALELIVEVGGLVPQVWHLETRNSLLTAERRGRISAGRADECLNALKELPIETDESPRLEVAFQLARAHGLSYYDALYLELASRFEASLVTLDARLARAAVAEGIEVLHQ